MAGLHDVLETYVGNGSVPGAVGLVARGNRAEVAVVGSVAVGGVSMARDSIFRLASITKPITAAAVMMLVDDGRIALDSPVGQWLPELAEPKVVRTPASGVDDVVPAVRAITVVDLISSRAGYGFASDFTLPAVQRLFSVQKDGREPQSSWTARAGVSVARSTSRPSIRGTCRAAMAGSAGPERRRTLFHPPERSPSCSRRLRRTTRFHQRGCGISGGARPRPANVGGADTHRSTMPGRP